MWQKVAIRTVHNKVLLKSYKIFIWKLKTIPRPFRVYLVRESEARRVPFEVMGATPLGPTLGDRAGVLDIRTRNKSVGPKLGERVQNQCGSAYRSRRTSSSNMVPRSRTGDEIGRCSVTKRNQFFTAEMIFSRKWKGIRKPSMFQKKEFGRKTISF